MTITIKRGKTFSRVYHPTTPPYIFKPISGITNGAPAMVHVPGHGLVDGQFVAVVSVKGMTQINAKNNPCRSSDYVKVTVIDDDHVSLNGVNTSEFRAYTGGGYLQFYTPLDMTGCEARRTIKDKIGGTMLLELTTANGRMAIDNVNHTITETISAEDTAAITWKKGVTDLELETSAGVVIELSPPEDVEVIGEVTT